MNFVFLQPGYVGEAVYALEYYGEGALIVAGGAAVVPAIQQRKLTLRALVSLANIPGLRFTRADEDGLHLGALNTLREIADSAQIQQLYPALSTACGLVGNVRVRNQATLGGNLALADQASDPPAVLRALDAAVIATNSAGSRRIPLQGFFHGPNVTSLQRGEVLTGIDIPPLPEGTRQVYLKYKSRSGEDRPCVGVAAVGSFQDGACIDLRVVIGSACPVPYRDAELEHKARGRALDAKLIAEIADGYAAGIDAAADLRGSAWYHRQVTRVFVRRALEALIRVEGNDGRG